MEVASQSRLAAQIPIISKNSDILMAFVVVSILAFMVISLPLVILDLLLSFNITFSLTILLGGMYIIKSLEFSAFPSVLLIVTLFKLALNIASTRIILLHEN